MPTYTDPVIAPSFTGAVYDKGGAVFDVKAYGATGDASTNDTTAIQAAVSAANAVVSSLSDSASVQSGKGAIVYFPPGIYLITSTLHISSGVSLRGAGMNTSQLRFNISTANSDALVWDQGSEASGIHHVGGGLDDIDVITGAVSGQVARDLVVLRIQLNFHITNARLHGAGRYGLRMEDCVHVTALGLYTHSCTSAGVLVGAVEGTGYNTTVNFQSCYFQNTVSGPGADVAGYGITFDGCIFESSGTTTAANGKGVVGRWGTFTLTNPYFENNYSWDMLFGTEAPSGFQTTTVTVINPILSNNGAKVSGTGGLRVERGMPTLLGGNYSVTTHPISLAAAPAVARAFVLVNVADIEVDGGGGSASVPGVVYAVDAASGRPWITGKQLGVQIGEGTTITGHLSTSSSTVIANPTAVAADAVASWDVPLTGAAEGDTAVASIKTVNGALPAGVLISASAGTNFVRVTIHNRYAGGAINLANPVVRVDVWKH
ncbi:MAG TPA: glycosyl hydrolase family 28-related protein [Longimicrobium sp.]|nr:glycosyl hydrolase family 28-related protein [Longimicrobium sp.]